MGPRPDTSLGQGWDGGVQVSLTQLMSDPALPTTETTLNLDIRVGETKSYYLRLTEQPTARRPAIPRDRVVGHGTR